MKSNFRYKLILTLILLVSGILLSVSIPILYKYITAEDTFTTSIPDLGDYKINICIGLVTGAIISLLSLILLEYEIQVKIARFLLILGAVLAAISFILIKSAA